MSSVILRKTGCFFSKMVDTIDMSEFHERLRDTWEDSRLTVKALALNSGVSARTIDKWLAKKNPTTPKIDEIAKLAKVLCVSLDYLAYGETFSDIKNSMLIKKYKKTLDVFEDMDTRRRDDILQMIGALSGAKEEERKEFSG